jgi:hypothetical protein
MANLSAFFVDQLDIWDQERISRQFLRSILQSSLALT